MQHFAGDNFPQRRKAAKKKHIQIYDATNQKIVNQLCTIRDTMLLGCNGL
jgi:hypothetical protein